jgi:hypothetical protein
VVFHVAYVPAHQCPADGEFRYRRLRAVYVVSEEAAVYAARACAVERVSAERNAAGNHFVYGVDGRPPAEYPHRPFKVFVYVLHEVVQFVASDLPYGVFAFGFSRGRVELHQQYERYYEHHRRQREYESSFHFTSTV